MFALNETVVKQAKRRSLKTLLLICIFPVFLGAGLTGILFNYFMARDNAQQRIDDHIVNRRMDLTFIAMLPSLKIYLQNAATPSTKVNATTAAETAG